MSKHVSRRELMGGSVLALASPVLLPSAPARSDDDAGFKLGVASYSLRKLSRADAIKAMEALKCRYINIKEFHAPIKESEAQWKQARTDFENAGITILGVGNISMTKEDEGEIRRNFEYAKTLGAPVIVMAPTAKTAPVIEKFVKEYNIRAAIHNHGPEDKHFPAPSDVLKVVKGMDERMGLCVDIGHTARTGTAPLDGLKQATSARRLNDIHVKDLADLMNKDSQVAVGDGAMPIPAIFQYLMKTAYKGGVMLEYEINADAPLPGMMKSFAYMRGVIAGLKA
jgi:sugar phosphate isomerase/epimerase